METSLQTSTRDKTTSLIREYYEAFNKGDTNIMLNYLTEDVIHDVNQGERRLGKEKFKAFNASMDRNYKEELKDIVIMVSSDGSRASAEFTVHGIYKNSDEGLPPAKGQKYVLPAGAFFSIRDGKIARVTTYYNLKDWIAQVSS